jgi:flagellar protein FliO/FliZ
MNTKIKLNLWFLFLLLPVLSGSAESSGQLNLLKDVTVAKDAETLTFRLDFNSQLKKNPNPVIYKKSIQFDFADAFSIPAKRSITTQDSMISQVFIGQLDPQTLRVRLVLGEGRYEVKDNIHLERKGNSLVIRIDKEPKDVLDKFLAKVKQAKAAEPKAVENKVKPAAKPALPEPKVLPAASPVVAEEAETVEIKAKATETKPEPLSKSESFGEAEGKIVESAVSAPVSETKPAVKPAIGQDKAGDFLNYKDPTIPEPPSLLASGWKMFYTLAIVLALMFLIVYVFKKVVLKNSVLGGNDKLIKVLSTGFLGPKKTIALVEVAGEVLVLGISDDNISLLTQIHDDERIEKIRAVNTGGIGKIWKRPEVEAKPAKTESTPVADKGNPFAKYIKKFSADAETVQISSIADVAALIRKNREKVKAAS